MKPRATHIPAKSLPALLVVFGAVVLSGCQSLEPVTFKGYRGSELPDSEIATIKLVSAYLVALDGKVMDKHPERYD